MATNQEGAHVAHKRTVRSLDSHNPTSPLPNTVPLVNVSPAPRGYPYPLRLLQSDGSHL